MCVEERIGEQHLGVRREVQLAGRPALHEAVLDQLFRGRRDERFAAGAPDRVREFLQDYQRVGIEHPRITMNPEGEQPPLLGPARGGQRFPRLLPDARQLQPFLRPGHTAALGLHRHAGQLHRHHGHGQLVVDRSPDLQFDRLRGDGLVADPLGAQPEGPRALSSQSEAAGLVAEGAVHFDPGVVDQNDEDEIDRPLAPRFHHAPADHLSGRRRGGEREATQHEGAMQSRSHR